MHPSGSRNDIPNRLKRQFCIFNSTLPSNNSLDHIFSMKSILANRMRVIKYILFVDCIASGYFCTKRQFKIEIVDLVKRLVPLTRIIWQQVKVKKKKL
jgi:dynein heavy chain